MATKEQTLAEWRAENAERLTPEQNEALDRLVERWGREGVELKPAGFGIYDAYIGVTAGRLYIGIEQDGYTHT